MDTSRRSAAELLEIVRVLLLVQGAILLATTIEAAVWSVPFGGAAAARALPSAAATVALFVARGRLEPERRWIRRIVYTVEGVILATLVIDAVLGIALARTSPPAVALLTRLVLPVAVIILLRRSSAAAPASRPMRTAVSDGVS